MANWFQISPVEGSGNGKIDNTSGEHTGRVKRELVVTVTGVGVSAPETYKLIQSPLAEFVNFTNGAEMAVNKTGGTVTVVGKSNSSKLTFAWVGSVTDVDLPTSYEAAGEVTANGVAIAGDPGAVSQYDYNIELSVPENTTIDEIVRTLKVTAAGGQSVQIAIKQAAGDAYLTVSPKEVTIAQAGGTVSVYVNSNTSWTVSY